MTNNTAMVRGQLISTLMAIVTGAVIVGCASEPSSGTPTVEPNATSETADAEVTAEPSDEDAASTAMAAAPTVSQTVVVDGLEHPWGLAWLPDDTMIVTERPGRVRLIRDGQLDPAALVGVPDVFASGQGGLLDVSVHPNFEANQWVYFTYADGDRAANQTRVARAQLDGDTLTNWQTIFEVNRAKEGGQHFGSRMTWLPDNTLLVSIGDGGNPPLTLDGDLIRQQAQNLDSHLGKIVRLNDDGTMPTDNPFADTPEAAPGVWSYGHRNIQGLM